MKLRNVRPVGAKYYVTSMMAKASCLRGSRKRRNIKPADT